MSELTLNRSRSPAPPPPAQPRRTGPLPPPRNGATSPIPPSTQLHRSPSQPIATTGLPNRTRQPPGIPGTSPSIAGSGLIPRSGSNPANIDARPMSPVSSVSRPEPPAIEGRWTFKTSVDFPIPPHPNYNHGKVYPSGNSSGTSIPLDLTSLVGLSAGRMPPPPPIGGGGHYR